MIRPLLCLLMVGAALPSATARAQAPAPSGRAPFCPKPPKLALSPEFPDARRIFSPTGRSFRTLESRFGSAYRLACRSRLRNAPVPVGTLFLKNAPDANTTSIYREGDEGEGKASGRMVMEHPFLGHDREVDIPSVDELRSAIVCSVYHLDPPGGQAGEGLECLVD